jgi:hypothetical protein
MAAGNGGRAPLRLFWIDDEIGDEFSLFLMSRLSVDGDEIEPFKITSEADMPRIVSAIADYAPDVILIDWRLSLGAFEGIELAQRVSQHHAGPMMFLTRFPKQDEMLISFDPRLRRLQCEKPSEDIEAMRTWYSNDFRPALSDLYEQKAEVVPLQLGSHEFFKRSPSDWRSFTLEAQLQAKQAAGNDLIPYARKIFDRRDIDWLIIVDAPAIVVEVGLTGRDLPGRDRLDAIQKRWDSVPLVLHRPAAVNVTSAANPSSDCGAGSSTDWFPTLRVEYEKQGFQFHFDTGAEKTFLSYEAMLDRNVVAELDDPNDWTALPLTVGLDGEKSILVHQLKRTIRCQKREGHIEEKVSQYLVRNFMATGLRLSCESTFCPRASEADSVDLGCQYRRGLIGRDLLLQTGWSILISVAERRVYVVDDANDGGASAANQAESRKRRKWGAG